jgi:hypothetical protein
VDLSLTQTISVVDHDKQCIFCGEHNEASCILCEGMGEKHYAGGCKC